MRKPKPPNYISTYINGESRTKHRVLAEQALGRKLPKGAQIHHLDNNPLNCDPHNLVICPDQSYHLLLHVRTRALKECGNANYKWCVLCKQWDDPLNLYYSKNPHHYYHRKCNAERKKKYKRNLKNNIR